MQGVNLQKTLVGCLGVKADLLTIMLLDRMINLQDMNPV